MTANANNSIQSSRNNPIFLLSSLATNVRYLVVPSQLTGSHDSDYNCNEILQDENGFIFLVLDY